MGLLADTRPLAANTQPFHPPDKNITLVLTQEVLWSGQVRVACHVLVGV